ncbi:MAG: anti-sigma regulatory factor [Capsulimonas sp.]|uniref:anti-sigma regulatory factor n=1 Tax=Capsulimonas sp. TaxID=2494211 RepID=UPI00326596F8
MSVRKSETMPIRTQADIVHVRQAVRTWSVDAGMRLVDQTKIVTAASELARNTLEYGGGGELLLESLSEGIRVGLRLTFTDHGPGIPDLELALKDGWTSGSGMGMGLSGSKRLSNEFEIESQVGIGTTVRITRWK